MLMGFAVVNFLTWSSVQFSMPSIRIYLHYFCAVQLAYIVMSLVSIRSDMQVVDIWGEGLSRLTFHGQIRVSSSAR
jgi:hypothetical protein